MTTSASASAESRLPTGRRPGPNRWCLLALVVVLVLDAALLTGAFLAHARSTRPPPAALITVQAAVGSENLAFFKDPDVRAEFANKGFDVVATGFGSDQLASIDLSKYDLAFPSSSVLAQKLVAKLPYQIAGVIPYSTPIAVATWTPIAQLLQKIGVSSLRDGTWYFDIAAYLRIVQQGMLWTQIPGNTSYPNPHQILLTTSDPRYSNSAEMFIAAASLALHKAVVQDDGPIPGIADAITPAFKAQGDLQVTTDNVFNDYLANGPGQVPMGLIYESEFLGEQLTNPKALPAGALLMYPDPLINSDHTVLPLKDTGQKIADLLKTDQRLEDLEENSFGFHNSSSTSVPFQRIMKSHGINVPVEYDGPVPTPKVLKDLIDAVEQRLTH